MKRLWACALGLSLTWPAPGARAGEPVSLGRPVALDAAPPVVRGQMPEPARPAPATLGAPIPSSPSAPRFVTVGSEEAYNSGMVPASAVAPPPPPPPPPVGVPPPGPGAPLPPGLAAPPGGPAGGGLFGCDALGCTCGEGRCLFQSDHCFDGFISPVSNPFLFEDPRALTEARPIFIYQHTPKSNYVFNGGDIDYFGTQLCLAVTERLSLVINKLGFIWVDPRDPTGLTGSSSGFAEFDFGPKYTFLRSEDTGTLGAAGMTVQLPTGSAGTFQNTGSASLVPYVSLGQHFGQSSYGSFNALATTGYAFALDSQRTDYFFLSAHLDYDVANLHKIYPLLELNWFHYTTAGKAVPFGFEGRDLINFGSTGVSGLDSLTIAAGTRYKFCENIQTGLAVEFPLTTARDLVNFRLTWDMIFRY